MTSLYICYQGIRDPLTKSQVVAYLEGLTRVGHKVVLLTFEPKPVSRADERAIGDELLRVGVVWQWLRYHKHPSVPATAFDIASGVWRGYRIARRYNAEVFHARGHVAALMAFCLKRMTGKRLLFDIRGFLAEEYVDAGVWPAGGILHRMAKRVERTIVHASDAFIVLTWSARRKLMAEYAAAVEGKRITMIPCCVDMRAVRQAGAGKKRGNYFVYVGKFGGWYWTEALTEFVLAARRLRPDIELRVFTQSPRVFVEAELARYGLHENVTVAYIEPHELLSSIQGALAGLCFIRPMISKEASSPTKVGDYLAAGLPVASVVGIGDLDELLLRNRAGVLLPRAPATADFDAAAAMLFSMTTDDDIGIRCQSAARANLDLEGVGWPAYRSVYEGLSADVPSEQ